MCYNGVMTRTNTFPRSKTLAAKPGKLAPTKCDRCGGAGGWEGWPGFTCYRCGGNGVDPTHRDWAFPFEWSDEQCEAFIAKREAQNAAARERAQAKREAARRETWNSNVEACPVLAEIDAEVMASTEAEPHRWHGFVNDIRMKAMDFPLSERQIEAVTKAYTEMIEREANPAPEVPAWEITGKRQTVEGVIGTRRWVESQFGSTLKIRVVTDAGQGLWVSCPRELVDCDKGDRVRLDCSVQVSEDDHTFAFGSRPTKAVVVQTAEEK